MRWSSIWCIVWRTCLVRIDWWIEQSTQCSCVFHSIVSCMKFLVDSSAIVGWWQMKQWIFFSFGETIIWTSFLIKSTCLRPRAHNFWTSRETRGYGLEPIHAVLVWPQVETATLKVVGVYTYSAIVPNPNWTTTNSTPVRYVGNMRALCAQYSNRRKQKKVPHY